MNENVTGIRRIKVVLNSTPTSNVGEEGFSQVTEHEYSEERIKSSFLPIENSTILENIESHSTSIAFTSVESLENANVSEIQASQNESFALANEEENIIQLFKPNERRHKSKKDRKQGKDKKRRKRSDRNEENKRENKRKRKKREKRQRKHKKKKLQSESQQTNMRVGGDHEVDKNLDEEQNSDTLDSKLVHGNVRVKASIFAEGERTRKKATPEVDSHFNTGKPDLRLQTPKWFDAVTKISRGKRRMTQPEREVKCIELVDSMRRAREVENTTELQTVSNQWGASPSPSIISYKVQFLPQLRPILSQQSSLTCLLRHGFLQEVGNWLRPIAHGSLPPFEVRAELIRFLSDIPCVGEKKRIRRDTSISRRSDVVEDEWAGLTKEQLLASGDLGSILQYYAELSTESTENRKIAMILCDRWARALTFDERELESASEDEQQGGSKVLSTAHEAQTRASRYHPVPRCIDEREVDLQDPDMWYRGRYVLLGPPPEIDCNRQPACEDEPKETLRSKAAEVMERKYKMTSKRHAVKIQRFETVSIT